RKSSPYVDVTSRRCRRGDGRGDSSAERRRVQSVIRVVYVRQWTHDRSAVRPAKLWSIGGHVAPVSRTNTLTSQAGTEIDALTFPSMTELATAVSCVYSRT